MRYERSQLYAKEGKNNQVEKEQEGNSQACLREEDRKQKSQRSGRKGANGPRGGSCQPDLDRCTVFQASEPATEGFFFFNYFIYLFLAVLGLRFCARAFSSCSKRGPLFIAVRGPLTIVASLVTEHRLQMRRLSSCGSRA